MAIIIRYCFWATDMIQVGAQKVEHTCFT